MANTYKNIVITPNIGSAIDDPKIVFSGANTTVDTDIVLKMYPASNGTLSFEGSSNTLQLFSISNSFSGVIFSVNDINGVPNIEVTDSGIIRMAQYTGNVQILGGQASTSNTTGELQVNGGVGITGNVYTGNIVITGITSNGITFADGTRMITAASGSGGGAGISGYLANSVIVANTTGFLSNTANLLYTSSPNILRANATITIANTTTTNTASIVYNASLNSIDFIFN